MESDDVAEPKFLERSLALLEARPELSFVFCRSQIIDETGNRGRLVPPSSRRDKEAFWNADFVMKGKEFLRQFLSYRSEIPNASAVLVRRKAYLEVGGSQTEMRLCGDWLLCAVS